MFPTKVVAYLKNLSKPIALDALALIAGIALVFAFAPFNFYVLATLCPAFLLYSVQQIGARRAAIRGFCFGLGFFGASVSWVYVSIHVYGQTPVGGAVLLTFLSVAVLALFPAAAVFLTQALFPSRMKTQCLLAFPFFWVLMEALRGWLFTGFPWVFLGYSQVSSPLSGYAPLISVYGISFLLVFTSGLLVLLVSEEKFKSLWFALLFLIWAAGWGLTHYDWVKPSGKEIKISLIQGNVLQSEKWQPEYLIKILQKYKRLTEENWGSQLIIWPEAAIPLPYDAAIDFLDLLSQQAAKHNASLLVGIPVREGKDTYYNALIALGKGKGRYYKRHLVPFGEYLPFSHLLRGVINFFDIPMSDFSPGEEHQPPITVNGAKISALICYEIAYLRVLLPTLAEANLIVVVSDDSWFGHSLAPAQHLQIAQMRALETGKTILFATNDGITAVIESNGTIQHRAPQFNEYVLTETIKLKTGKTPLVALFSEQ